MTTEPWFDALRCPECGVPLELGHDCLAGRFYDDCAQCGEPECDCEIWPPNRQEGEA